MPSAGEEQEPCAQARQRSEMAGERKRSADKDVMLGLYRKVLLVREFEEKVYDLDMKKKTYKVSTFRGVELSGLLDMKTPELVKLLRSRHRRR